MCSAPVEVANWLAADGPSNDQDNHHRPGVVIIDGRAVDSRRYAIDWKQIRDGASFSGERRDVHSYYSYGKAVLAVADGVWVTARDGLPDNIPGHGEAFHPAVPITLEQWPETQSRWTWGRSVCILHAPATRKFACEGRGPRAARPAGGTHRRFRRCP